MYQTSLALNRQSSYLQQAPLLNEGKRKQREQMNTTTGFELFDEFLHREAQ